MSDGEQEKLLSRLILACFIRNKTDAFSYELLKCKKLMRSWASMSYEQPVFVCM